MLKIASRWIFLGYIWSKYHRRIKSLCLCLVLVAIIVSLHSEYISYCEATKQQACNIGLSYIAKWGSALLVVVVVTAWVKFPVTRKTSSKEARLEPPNHTYKEDGFDVIRRKSKLVSRGDRIIQSKPDR